MSKTELETHFYALGRYYISERLGKVYVCRAVMELRRKGTALEQPNAVVVMTNPGGSYPKEGPFDLPLEEAQLVAAEPDLTQYQLMYLMFEFNWSYVRVINLLDLRTSNSGELGGLLQNFAGAGGICELSIFANSRSLDLEEALERTSRAPLILAWGCNYRLGLFAQAALKALTRHPRVIGWKHPKLDWAFYHPLPRGQLRRQEEWRQIICDRLQKSK